MKIALAQLNYHIGNFEANLEKIITSIHNAKAENTDLIVFSELAISGYPPRDFLEFDDFIDQCNECILKIAEETKDIAVIVGSPRKNPKTEGKELLNSAFFLNNGGVERIFNKTLLPTYDVFDEYRYFEPNTIFDLVDYKGTRIAVTICEDLWNVGNDPLYPICPMDEIYKKHPELIINISASPFHYDQANERKRVLKANAEKYQLPVIYVNHVGAQTELIFDGGSMVMNEQGEIVKELSYFEEDFAVVDISAISAVNASPATALTPPDNKIKLIHDALVLGIRDYFRKLGFTKATLGLSGGIDSAVTFALAAEALGNKNVFGVLLPGRFSSEHSIEDAKRLAYNLDAPFQKISIEKPFIGFEDALKSAFKNLPFDLTEENLQARTRAVILMAMCNKFGYILLNTSNKSEAAVGYGTLYGDMCGGISVLGDVYKTEVYELAHYINRDTEIIPHNSIAKPPSAELRPGQKDSDSLPEYHILDQILFQYIEKRKGPGEIIEMGFEKEMVKKVLRLVNISEYKRYQTPPILRVSPKAFGMGRRMPIAAKYLS